MKVKKFCMFFILMGLMTSSFWTTGQNPIDSWFIQSANIVEASAKEIGSIQSQDFVYKGVGIGDTADKLADWGEPLFDTDMSVWGYQVTKYTYDKGLTAFVDKSDNTIVEIDLDENACKNYVAREGVTYGSMRGKLFEVYGDAAHTQINGLTCYVYTWPSRPDYRLVIELDNENFYLIGMRLTSLPLTAEEGINFDKASTTGTGNEADKWDFGHHFHYSTDV